MVRYSSSIPSILSTCPFALTSSGNTSVRDAHADHDDQLEEGEIRDVGRPSGDGGPRMTNMDRTYCHPPPPNAGTTDELRSRRVRSTEELDQILFGKGGVQLVAKWLGPSDRRCPSLFQVLNESPRCMGWRPRSHRPPFDATSTS